MSNVDHPSHYNQFDIEVIALARHLPFDAGNFLKYVMRAPFKGEMLEDLQKALWYAQDFSDHLKLKDVRALSKKKEHKLTDKANYFVTVIQTKLNIPESLRFGELFNLMFQSSVRCKGYHYLYETGYKMETRRMEAYIKNEINDLIDCIKAKLEKNENQGAGC